MNTQSLSLTARMIALLAIVAVALAAAPAVAQPGFDGIMDKLDLNKDQRAKVREIMKAHREESREELHKKLTAVLTDEQLEKLEALHGEDFPLRWERPFGKRGGRGGMRGGHHGCSCCCCEGGGRGDMRGGRQGRGGPGPHMGAMRGERGEMMIERLTVVLDLSDDQVAKVKDIVAEHQDQFKDFDRSGLSFEERQETREAHRTLLASRIKEVLTDDQKEKYDEWLETMPEPKRRGRRVR